MTRTKPSTTIDAAGRLRSWTEAREALGAELADDGSYAITWATGGSRYKSGYYNPPRVRARVDRSLLYCPARISSTTRW